MPAINRIQGHAQRFEQRRLNMVHRIRHWKTRVSGHVHPLTETAPIRIISAKMQAAAQVWMPLLAKLAPSAGLRRVNRHTHSCLQRVEISIQRIRAHRLNSRRKFVPKHKRTLNGRTPNPRVLVGMEVAAANPRYTDPQQDITGFGWPTVRDPLQTHVAGPVQARGQHCG